ncbi:MAG TPA: alpha/beta fold hydrolase, partial [Candidatus Limnocylindrales bacterium]|nr:alpha/beta fold hydrolase [Candidatus Limnocylindrales bacterium]
LPGGLPYFRFGTGPRLVVLRGFTTTHDNPKGLQRTFEVKLLAPLARRFDVFAVNRAPGLSPGTTMADIARQHAAAIREAFGEPIDLLGISSGGSIALQVAADHPDVVRRRESAQDDEPRSGPESEIGETAGQGAFGDRELAGHPSVLRTGL